MFSSLFVILLIVVLLLVALAGGFYVYIYWVRIQRPAPKLSGDHPVFGLENDVEILRDKHAIPQIFAQSRADLWRAQGYTHAQERFWQMEQARRTAYGTLSEIFGVAALDADRFSRVIGFGRAAQVEVTALDDDTRTQLHHYAEGVNAYLSSHPKRVAAELNLLRVEPAEWRVVDSVALFKVFAWSQCINWESELTRLRLVQQLGPTRAADLEPDAPRDTPIILEGVSSVEMTRLLDAAGLLLNQYEQVKQWFGIVGEGQGSNSWVLSPKRSLNGRALLAADPHMPLQIPGIFFENRLQCDDLDVSGASLPGVPGVLIGHNQRIAWGLTNALVDVQDLYLERIAESKPGHFVYADGEAKARVHDEEITVRRRNKPHLERVITSRHGPVISGLLTDAEDGDQFRAVPLALRWTGFEPGTTLRAILRLNGAHDWHEFDDALVDWCEPPLNVTYADVDGNIGYTLAGRIPCRKQNLGLLPSAGWSNDDDWSTFIPHSDLPKLYNPDSGIIVSANNKMIGDDYPNFLGIEFMPGWRAARIEEMLSKKERHTIRDLEEIQKDTASKFAEALAPWFGLLYSNDPWEKAALDAIRTWNYRMDPDSTAALVFHYSVLRLLDMMFGDKIGPAHEGYLGMTISPILPSSGFMSRAELRLLQILDANEESVWYLDATTGEARTRDELLQAALSQAVRQIRSTVGDSTRKWDWGRSHQIRYVHPMGSARFLRGFFNRGPFPIGGDGTTPMQTRHAPRLPLGLVQITPAYRQIFEVGAWDRGEAVSTGGQSGHPLSDHYDDQITMFREGVYHTTPWSRAAVEESTVYRMRLVSGSR